MLYRFFNQENISIGLAGAPRILLVGDRDSVLSTGPTGCLRTLAFSPSEKLEANLFQVLCLLWVHTSVSLVTSDGPSSLSLWPLQYLALMTGSSWLSPTFLVSFPSSCTLLPAGKISPGVQFRRSLPPSLEVIAVRRKDLRVECVPDLVGWRHFSTL